MVTDTANPAESEMDAWFDASMARLRELIDADPRTDSSIAMAAGLHKVHLSQIRTGKRSPNYRTIVALMIALGRSPSDLDPGRPMPAPARSERGE